MIHFPRNIEEAVAALSENTEVRAGGTDWMERHELGLTAPDVVDLRDVSGISEISRGPDGSTIVGAGVTLRTLAGHTDIRAHYPALVLAASALATPQIRAVATVAGSLLQRNRCWYFRSPQWRCFKSGGDRCPARAGDHHFHVCFDRGPCAAPHPSTVGMALFTYDAKVRVSTENGVQDREVKDLFGDGSDPSHDHRLAPRELLTAVVLPPPTAAERGGYFRATSRAYAEWPLVEVSVRLVWEAERVTLARVGLGGVANVPLRASGAESVLLGSMGGEAFERAGQAAAVGAQPLPMTGYKVKMIPGAVVETLQRALAQGA